MMVAAPVDGHLSSKPREVAELEVLVLSSDDTNSVAI